MNIPARRLKHLADIHASNVDKKSVEGDLPVRLCNYVDVYKNDMITNDIDFMRATASISQVQEFELRRGDVLITKDSESADDIGVPAYVPENLKGVVCGYHLSILRSNTRVVDPTFLAWVLRSEPTRQYFTTRAKGITRFALGYSDIGDLPVPVPAASEQRAIVRFLHEAISKIDALVEAKRDLVGLLRERFGQELDGLALPGFRPRVRATPDEVPLPGEAPADWRVVPIGHCLRRITYGFTSPMPTTDDGPFLLTANDIDDGSIRFHSARRTSFEAFGSLTNKSRPQQGDVLLTKDGSLGRSAIYEGERIACVNQSVAVLTPRHDVIEPALLGYLLRVPAYREALIHNAGGTTIKHLYITRVVKQRIAFPTLSHQGALINRFDAIFSKFDFMKTSLLRSVDLLLEYRSALITAAVTGQIDVGSAA